MNIVFWFLVAVFAFLFWLGLSSLFKKVGGWTVDTYDRVRSDMEDDSKKEGFTNEKEEATT